MKNIICSAKFITFSTIEVLIFTDTIKENYVFDFCVNDIKAETLKPIKHSSFGSIETFLFDLKNEISLGEKYTINIENIGNIIINANDLALLDEFDKKFFYEKDDLGSLIKDNTTTFKIWAPLASSVYLKFIENDTFFEMKREEKGVFKAFFDKNLHGTKYVYIVNNNGGATECLDPYGKASLPNGKASVVVDFSKFDINYYDESAPKIKNYTEAIIYESHIRDLTSHVSANIKNKSTFAGLCEENTKTNDGFQTGFDYIKSLGITHLQLLPVLDFLTIDEINKFDRYNWGYDPFQYFSLEGSYSSNINDPFSAIIDFKNLISKFHKAGIGINLDVVYNHVYEYQYSNFEKVVPNYFFRRGFNGKLTNCSGCGNDLATERAMVRKMVVDSAEFLVKEYHIDGLRFDLMGLIDTQTLNEIKDKTLKINPNLMLYGEGWDMYSKENYSFGNMNNSFFLEKFGFFNDRFRDSIKGNSFDKWSKGYGLANHDIRFFMDFILRGSCDNIRMQRLFISANQSLNYVECHDNETLFDKISYCNASLSLDKKLENLLICNAITILSYGVPFIHAGQEFGMSKNGKNNTYNDNSGINNFDYDLAFKRKTLIDFFKEMISIRKSCKFMQLSNSIDISKNINVGKFGDCGVIIDYDNKDSLGNKIKIYLNPANETFEVDENSVLYEVVREEVVKKEVKCSQNVNNFLVISLK